MAPRIRILVVRLVFIFILVLGAVVFMATITNASIGRIVTGFGLLSVALGFALKSPLENMISGIITILVAPFRIGDEIEVGDYSGRVETINIHDTILHTFDGKKVAIPNADVYLNAIVNQTAYSRRRYDVLVGIHYNDDLPKAVEVAREVLDSVEGVRPSPEPLVLVSELNEYSVDLILRFWSDPTMSDEFHVVSGVTKEVKLAFDREGISDTVPDPNPPPTRRRREERRNTPGKDERNPRGWHRILKTGMRRLPGHPGCAAYPPRRVRPDPPRSPRPTTPPESAM